ncbi:MAG: DUF6070 family protein [Coprobacillus sp.]
MNKLKYIMFIILSLFFIVVLFNVYNNDTEIKINESDATVTIPDSEVKTIEKEIKELNSYIEIVKNNDMSGYSKGQGVPALSKQGVKSIYDSFKEIDASVEDEQGYFNLQNVEVFHEFFKKYNQGEKCRFTHYKILLTGKLIRKDFIHENNQTYVFISSLDFKDNKLFIEDIYGKQIKNLAYDQYGYFSYEYVLSQEGKLYGEQQYSWMKVDPMSEELREYNQRYLQPISYYCNNMFTTDWTKENVQSLNFNDLIEYLYIMDTDKAFPNENFPQSYATNVRRIEASYFEKLIQKYFNIKTSQIQNHNFYDKETNSYPYLELCCRASHWQLPELFSEVTKVEKTGNDLTLTVHVMGYEEGYPFAFAHQVTIENNGDSFQYISNQIIPSTDNKIPDYTPGINEEIMKDYNETN